MSVIGRQKKTTQIFRLQKELYDDDDDNDDENNV